jgi:hypothetical protein
MYNIFKISVAFFDEVAKSQVFWFVYTTQNNLLLTPPGDLPGR